MPGLAAIAEVECEDVSRLPGPHVTPEHMWRLARRAAAWLERPDVQGLVVTHGTDTLEETAYLLDLLLLSDKPVVIVGAIRTISEAGWDGPANLLAAVRVAAAPESTGRGVLVVMNEQILTASEAQKIHTESAGSFASPEFGPVGVLDAGKVLYVRMAPRHGAWTRRRRRHRACASRGSRPRVDLIKSAAGADDRFLRCSLAAGATGHRHRGDGPRQPAAGHEAGDRGGVGRRRPGGARPRATAPAASRSATATTAAGTTSPSSA